VDVDGGGGAGVIAYDLGHGAKLCPSTCLCPPMAKPPAGHVCVHGRTLWVLRDGAWYRVDGARSVHHALTVGRRCESWGQMVADLDLVLWVDR
jgi:hypothetical protein